MGSSASVVTKSDFRYHSVRIVPQYSKAHEESKSTNFSENILRQIKNEREIGIGVYFTAAKVNLLSNSKELIKSGKKFKKWESILSTGSKMVLKKPNFQSMNLPFIHEYSHLNAYATKNPKKFSAKVIKGPPAVFRWLTWTVIMRIEEIYSEPCFEKILAETPEKEAERDILKDLHRTFPELPYFSSEKFKFIGQDQLFRVLRAISVTFPSIGYCQGINFLAGFLLIISGGREIETFWLFCRLAADPRFYIIGFFEPNFPTLYLLIHIFFMKLSKSSPSLAKKFKSENLCIEAWIFKWFLSFFVSLLPLESVVRVWDFIFCNGLFSLVKIAIAIVKMHERELLSLDSSSMSDFFSSIKDSDSFESRTDELIDIASKITIKDSRIPFYTEDYVNKFPQLKDNIFIDYFLNYNQSANRQKIERNISISKVRHIEI